MVEVIFKREEYDDDATCKNVLHALRQYKNLVEKRAQLESVFIAAQAYDGMPHSDTNINNEETKMMKRLSEQEEVKMEMFMFDNALKNMGALDDQSEKLATLLRLQFFEGNGPEICCAKYAAKYKLPDLPRATFYDYRKIALLKFAGFYPRELRVKKVS